MGYSKALENMVNTINALQEYTERKGCVDLTDPEHHRLETDMIKAHANLARYL